MKTETPGIVRPPLTHEQFELILSALVESSNARSFEAEGCRNIGDGIGAAALERRAYQLDNLAYSLDIYACNIGLRASRFGQLTKGKDND